MAGLAPEVSTWLLSQGPAGVIILVLISVIIVLFRRWDADREKLIEYGAKYAELAISSAKVIETTNGNAGALIQAVQTVKLLFDIDRGRRP